MLLFKTACEEQKIENITKYQINNLNYYEN